MLANYLVLEAPGEREGGSHVWLAGCRPSIVPTMDLPNMQHAQTDLLR